MMEKIIDLLHSGGYSCVIRNGTEIRTFTQRGVADLYDLFRQDPSFMKGAGIADKVIGKAAAGLMVLGGIRQVYADVISQPALALLHNANIEVSYVRLVPFIENRDKSGWCPLETACYGIESIQEIFRIIENFLSKIRMKKNLLGILLVCAFLSSSLQAQVRKDTTQAGHNYEIDDVVVTGTRNETDIRHLPMTISVVNRETIGQRSDPSPHIDRTGSRIVHHQSWGDGIWSVKRCGRRYQPAWYRWQPHYRIIGID